MFGAFPRNTGISPPPEPPLPFLGDAPLTASLLARMYGPLLPPALAAAKVVHVTACYEVPLTTPSSAAPSLSAENEGTVTADRCLYTLMINENTPKSDWDFLALNTARASCDASLVSGQLLRDEPALQCGVQGRPDVVKGLLAWRQERIAREDAAKVTVGTGTMMTVGTMTVGTMTVGSSPSTVGRSPTGPDCFILTRFFESSLEPSTSPVSLTPSPTSDASLKTLRCAIPLSHSIFSEHPEGSVTILTSPRAHALALGRGHAAAAAAAAPVSPVATDAPGLSPAPSGASLERSGSTRELFLPPQQLPCGNPPFLPHAHDEVLLNSSHNEEGWRRTMMQRSVSIASVRSQGPALSPNPSPTTLKPSSPSDASTALASIAGSVSICSMGEASGESGVNGDDEVGDEGAESLDAVAAARAALALGARRVSIELGPNSTHALYARSPFPAARDGKDESALAVSEAKQRSEVDLLLLSVYRGPLPCPAAGLLVRDWVGSNLPSWGFPSSHSVSSCPPNAFAQSLGGGVPGAPDTFHPLPGYALSFTLKQLAREYRLLNEPFNPRYHAQSDPDACRAAKEALEGVRDRAGECVWGTDGKHLGYEGWTFYLLQRKE